MTLTAQQTENVKIMLLAGALDIKVGSVELHFDSAGRIASIDGHLKMFRREKLPTVAMSKIS